ncbi:MAG: DUF4127 family protein [Armatimonadota bacterium]|nr:DUF4127 family protein [Armatimonadota bacterium]
MSLRHRAHRVIYVPLDDRPCNAKLPRLLARMVDFELVMPPLDLLGGPGQAAQPTRIGEWLMEPHGRIDAAVLSLEMLAYGGLVASRTMGVSTETALARLDVLSRLREQLGEAAVYAFNVIMGLSITADTPEASQYWDAMREYSELSHRVRERGEDELQGQLTELEESIPPEIINDYQATRQRNHRVNVRAVDETAARHIDFLALTQERAAQFGPHLDEQERLRDRIALHNIEDRAMIYPGTDEAGMTLLARFIHRHMLKTPTVRVIFSSEEGAQRTAPFEDRPLRETVEAHVAAVGAQMADEDADADLVLAVSTPAQGGRQDCERGPARDRRRREVRGLLERASELSHRRVLIADVAFPNGADEALMRELRHSDLQLHRLLSFAAWNAAGNSLGCALAHGTLRLIALQDKGAFDLAQLLADISPMRYLELLNSLIDSERAHVELLFGRFVDDWLYQSRVRPQVTDRVVKLLEASVLDLASSYRQVERMVAQELGAAAGDLWSDHFLAQEMVQIGVEQSRSGLVLDALEETRLRLPWRRMSEVDLDFTFGLELVPGSEQ